MATQGTEARAGRLVWARVLGRGAVHREDGHDIAVNASGCVLVAARFEAAPAGELLSLGADGTIRWRHPVAGPEHRAPRVAHDETGAAFVLGPYQPSGRDGFLPDLTMRVTKLDTEGIPRWSTSFSRPDRAAASGFGRPMSLAADGQGGAGVAWVEGQYLCLARFGVRGGLQLHRFPFLGSMEPRVGLALGRDGGALVWGSFSGALLLQEDKTPIVARTHARFFTHVQADGRARWGRALRMPGAADCAVAVHDDGSFVLGTVLPPRPREQRSSTERDLVLARLDADGSLIEHIRFKGAPHTCASVTVASTGGGTVALAGYFSGRFTIGGHDVASRTAARESIFVGRAGPADRTWARALHGPELQGGLSVHGDASGAVFLAGWSTGPLDLAGESGSAEGGPRRIQEGIASGEMANAARIPEGAGAAFFVAKYGA